MEMEKQKITYRCKGCGHRLFDMEGNNCIIEIKCEKCRRFLRIRSGKVMEIRTRSETVI